MPQNKPFRLRAHEVTRVEAFSDIVFGFALTLIVVSLEVPSTFAALMHEMQGFLGFAICFAVLMWVWYEHNTFFRRYGLTDGYAIVINTMLLFLVLFYTYPLKFLFSAMTRHINPGPGDAGTIFLIYALGFTGIFAAFFLLYLHAWSRREELELNAVELHDTRTTMMMYSAYIAVGLLSAAIALVANTAWMQFAGWVFFLLGPLSAIIGSKRGALRKKLEASS
jgi:uncharacterized membrane protein